MRWQSIQVKKHQGLEGVGLELRRALVSEQQSWWLGCVEVMEGTGCLSHTDGKIEVIFSHDMDPLNKTKKTIR